MLKKFFMPLMLSATCALFLAGCGGADNTSTTNTTTNTTGANKTTTTSTPTVNPTPTTTTPTTPVSGDKVGVPECDDFLAKYEACVTGKVPAAARAQFQTILTQWRKAWRDAAATPQGKAGLGVGCKAALDQSKTSMKPYGCEF